MGRRKKTKYSGPPVDKGTVEAEAEVISCLKGLQFLVKTSHGHEAICHLSGKIRSRRTITAGDMVLVELSSYDFTRGRIVWRLQDKRPGEKKLPSTTEEAT